MSSSEEPTPSDLPSVDKFSSGKATCFVSQSFILSKVVQSISVSTMLDGYPSSGHIRKPMTVCKEFYLFWNAGVGQTVEFGTAVVWLQ